MTAHEILNIGLGIAAAMILASFLYAQIADGDYSKFKLIKLISNKDGEPDSSKMMEWGVFVLMAWGFVVFVVDKKLPEWYVTMFVGAFVARSAYSAWLRTHDDKQKMDSRNFRDDRKLPPVPRPQERGQDNEK